MDFSLGFLTLLLDVVELITKVVLILHLKCVTSAKKRLAVVVWQLSLISFPIKCNSKASTLENPFASRL